MFVGCFACSMMLSLSSLIVCWLSLAVSVVMLYVMKVLFGLGSVCIVMFVVFRPVILGMCVDRGVVILGVYVAVLCVVFPVVLLVVCDVSFIVAVVLVVVFPILFVAVAVIVMVVVSPGFMRGVYVLVGRIVVCSFCVCIVMLSVLLVVMSRGFVVDTVWFGRIFMVGKVLFLVSIFCIVLVWLFRVSVAFIFKVGSWHVVVIVVLLVVVF